MSSSPGDRALVDAAEGSWGSVGFVSVLKEQERVCRMWSVVEAIRWRSSPRCSGESMERSPSWAIAVMLDGFVGCVDSGEVGMRLRTFGINCCLCCICQG